MASNAAAPRSRSVRALLLPGIVAFVLVTGACTADDPSAGVLGGDSDTNDTVDLDRTDISLVSGLENYQSCDALLERLKSEGLERVGPYGFGQGGWYGPMPMEMAEEGVAADDSAGGSASADMDRSTAMSAVADDGVSTTNNQEAGVDEADIVKTDGNRLVIASGNKLRVIDLATGTLVREIELGSEAWGGELFLAGDTAILMTQGWSEEGLNSARSMIMPVGSPTTRIQQVDLVSGTVGRVLEFEGSYLSARDIDGTVRIVLWAGMGNLPFLYPSNPGSEDQATENNRSVIEDSVIEQWLPAYRLLHGSSEIESGSLVGCDRMMVPGAFSGFGALTVLTIDAAGGLEPSDAIGVLSDGQTVYSSTARLAVATARWPEWNADGVAVSDDAYTTLIHSFDITDPTRTEYVASGSVDGHMLNQYSLSEHDGYLRVATTAGDPWSGQDSSESFVTVLAEDGSALQTVGKVGGIGKGERIFAVRFMGERAYVVTFRQVDPLYALDLSDPTNPTILGELKIPGFSSYLHPVADGLLLGVGQDASEDGMIEGSQVSLFDVSDPAAPQRIDQVSLGAQAYSQVEWDARAFTWWSPTSTGLIPISWYRYEEASGAEDNGTAVVAIDVVDRALVERARIQHPATEQCERVYDDGPIPLDSESTDAESGLVESSIAPPGEYCWTWAAEIRRSVIADDTIYTISDSGVMRSRLGSYEQLGWIPFSVDR